jgi:hypothetical protein
MRMTGGSAAFAVSFGVFTPPRAQPLYATQIMGKIESEW